MTENVEQPKPSEVNLGKVSTASLIKEIRGRKLTYQDVNTLRSLQAAESERPIIIDSPKIVLNTSGGISSPRESEDYFNKDFFMSREDKERRQKRIERMELNKKIKAESSYVSGGYKREEREKIVKNVIENVRNLTGNDMIDKAILEIKFDFETDTGFKTLQGLDALRNVIANPLGSILSVLELRMSSPEAVYMSGVIIKWGINRSRAKIGKRVQEIESNQIKFVTQEAREADLNKNKDRFGFLNKFGSILSDSLEKYSLQYLPDKKYTEILESITFIGGINTSKVVTEMPRNEIIYYLKKKDIEKAHDILKNARRKKKKRKELRHLLD